ncbi:HET-domain-containing protein [Mollisia scopiformis]|uniref:HET-domain-containing protein n=1 Tax=Mollisia scopiformis TaxID=149040 RepID=A0A194WU95_MOLSC|nr:HET-domain-containing protein [Mollisia scopiformis]KUJ11535.1 HET-domain-containing protein [Mollisia scopiformis]
MNVIRLEDLSWKSIFNSMAAWLHDCDKAHMGCPRVDEPALPTRVLDLGESDTCEKIKLHISVPLQHGRYVALSYCWGGPQQMTTTTTTIDSMIAGIALNSVPKTIRDAIQVTKKLGIRYLWIDSLCIIQDAGYDKLSEIASMGDIYKNSTVTIAASSTESVFEGFLDDKIPWDICRLPLYLDEDSSGTIHFAQQTKWSARDQRLFTRGWAFQEFMLSPRVILFDDVQPTWHCYSESFRALVPGYIDYNHPEKLTFGSILESRRHSTYKGGRSRLWATLINEYSSRDLTFFEDRLPAISGIAMEFSLLWEDDYIAGYWKSDLPLQLA